MLAAATLALAACTAEDTPDTNLPQAGEDGQGVPIIVRMAATAPAARAAAEEAADDDRVWFYSWFYREDNFNNGGYSLQPDWTASVRLAGLTAQKQEVSFVEGPQSYPLLANSTRTYFAVHPKPTAYHSNVTSLPNYFSISNPDGKADPMGLPKGHTLGFNSGTSAYKIIDCTLHHLCSKLRFTVCAGSDAQHGQPATGVKVTGVEVRNVVLPVGIVAIPDTLSGSGMYVYPDVPNTCSIPTAEGTLSVVLPDIPSEGVTVGAQAADVGSYLIVAPCIVSDERRGAGDYPTTPLVHRGTSIEIVVKTDRGDYAPATVTLDNTKVDKATRKVMESYSWYSSRTLDNKNITTYDMEKDLMPGVAYTIAIDLHQGGVNAMATVEDWEQAGQGTNVLPD